MCVVWPSGADVNMCALDSCVEALVNSPRSYGCGSSISTKIRIHSIFLVNEKNDKFVRILIILLAGVDKAVHEKIGQMCSCCVYLVLLTVLEMIILQQIKYVT